MILGILIGAVLVSMTIAIFSAPKSKMDFTPAFKWGGLLSGVNTISADERSTIYRSADDATWRDAEPEKVIIAPSVVGVIPNDCKETQSYRTLSLDEQSRLFDALLSSKTAVKPPPTPKEVFRGSDTLEDVEPFAIQHWARENNVISSCLQPKAAGKKGNR